MSKQQKQQHKIEKINYLFKNNQLLDHLHNIFESFRLNQSRTIKINNWISFQIN